MNYQYCKIMSFLVSKMNWILANIVACFLNYSKLSIVKLKLFLSEERHYKKPSLWEICCIISINPWFTSHFALWGKLQLNVLKCTICYVSYQLTWYFVVVWHHTLILTMFTMKYWTGSLFHTCTSKTACWVYSVYGISMIGLNL